MKLLLSGLDTVECAYYLAPGSECKIDFAAFRERRELMRRLKDTEQIPFELGGTEFMLSPNGTKSGYPFLISNKDCTIQFGEFNNPSFFVKYSSLALWTKGAKALNETFLKWADGLGFDVIKSEGLSRCDFAFDFHLPEIDFDENSFVTLADKDNKHRKNGKVQTFSFGSGDIVLRIYNKSDEIKEASQKTWFFPLWGGQTENVWRVEWQVRKETLKRFDLRSFQDLFDGYGDALRFLVAEHTSLRVKSNDSNRSRWPVHPLWSMLAEHIDALPAQGVYRNMDPQTHLDESLIRMAISIQGYLKKVAAIECLKQERDMLTQRQAIDLLIPMLQRVHNQLTWRKDVQQRIDVIRIGA